MRVVEYFADWIIGVTEWLNVEVKVSRWWILIVFVLGFAALYVATTPRTCVQGVCG